MEGSAAAGQAGGDAGDAQGQGQAQDNGNAAIAAQLEQLSGGFSEMQQFLQSAPWQQQDAGEEQQDDGLDLSFLDDDQAMSADPAALAQQLQETINQHSSQQVQQALQPLVQQLTEVRTRLDAADLVGEFPELGSEEQAQRVVQAAQEWATNIGQPELASNPMVWRMVYMASKAAESANNEGSDDPGAAHLEGGSGAAPGGNSQVDLGDLIVNAGSNARLPFS